jgi:hypothetical protein
MMTTLTPAETRRIIGAMTSAYEALQPGTPERIELFAARLAVMEAARERSSEREAA